MGDRRPSLPPLQTSLRHLEWEGKLLEVQRGSKEAGEVETEGKREDEPRTEKGDPESIRVKGGERKGELKVLDPDSKAYMSLLADMPADRLPAWEFRQVSGPLSSLLHLVCKGVLDTRSSRIREMRRGSWKGIGNGLRSWNASLLWGPHRSDCEYPVASGLFHDLGCRRLWRISVP